MSNEQSWDHSIKNMDQKEKDKIWDYYLANKHLNMKDVAEHFNVDITVVTGITHEKNQEFRKNRVLL